MIGIKTLTANYYNRVAGMGKSHFSFILAVAFMLASVLPGFLHAAAGTVRTPVASCTEITQPGSYFLQNDLSSEKNAACIVIKANGVGFDCAGKAISGNGLQGSIGINITGYGGASISNCAIDRFDYGIRATSSSQNSFSNISGDSNSHFIYLKNSTRNSVRKIYGTNNAGETIWLVSSDFNNISGVASAKNGYSAIALGSSNFNSISGVNAEGMAFGVYMTSSSGNTLDGLQMLRSRYSGLSIGSNSRNNTVSNVVSDWNGKHGVQLWGNSSGNSLSWIKASYNGETGVYLSFASNNTLSLAFANSNFGNGIALVGGSQSNVLSRVASNNNSNGSGVIFSQSGSNTLFKGHSSGNAEGITLLLSDANNITGMSVMSSRRNGMNIAFSANNSATKNSIEASGSYGILLNHSSRNAIFDNLLSNSQNALVTLDSGENTWSLPAPLASTNVVGGPYTGGNYWGAPDGNGYSQQCPLQFPEGICHDVYYVRGENNRDNYPLADYVQPVPCTGSSCKAQATPAQAS